MTVEIIQGDAREVLRAMPAESVHCVVTSPPYWGQRDYGLEPLVWGGGDCQHEWGEESYQRRSNDGGKPGRKQETNVGAVGRDVPVPHAFCRRCNAWRGSLGLEPTPELYVEHLVEVMREVRRVLRDDGSLWLNMGDAYNSAASWGRDKGTSTLDGGRPAGYRKGSTRADGIVTQASPRNRDGVAAAGLKPKDLLMMPARVALALQADGWWLRSDIIWSKPNPMPESVTDRPTRSHEYVFLLTKSARYFYDADAIREPHTDESARRYLRGSSYTGDPNATQYAMKNGPRGHGLANRQDAQAYARMRDRQDGIGRQKWDKDGAPTWVKGHSGYINADGRVMVNEAGRNKRSVWEIATQPYPEAHFATFPEKLVEPCILAGTSEWGCCPECGAPWERVTERGELREHPAREGRSVRNVAFDGEGYSETGGTLGLVADTKTIGWRPTCDHKGEPVGCRVLDCFAGSGTVGLVAERLGRHSVLIELNPDYVAMARQRTAQLGLVSMEAKA